MRDSTAYQMQAANAKRNALLLSQHEFLKTRQEAFEQVLKNGGAWARFGWMLKPKTLLDAVDAVQMLLLDEAKRRIEAAAEAQKAKSRLVVPR